MKKILLFSIIFTGILAALSAQESVERTGTDNIRLTEQGSRGANRFIMILGLGPNHPKGSVTIQGAYRSQDSDGGYIDVKIVGENAFKGQGLTSLTINANLDEIRAGAFADNRLTQLSLPDSLADIGEGAFSGNQLRSVTIPSGVKSIGPGAFRGNRLTSITIASGSEVYIDSAAFAGNPVETITIAANIQMEADALPNNFPAYYASIGLKSGTYAFVSPPLVADARWLPRAEAAALAAARKATEEELAQIAALEEELRDVKSDTEYTRGRTREIEAETRDRDGGRHVPEADSYENLALTIGTQYKFDWVFSTDESDNQHTLTPWITMSFNPSRSVNLNFRGDIKFTTMDDPVPENAVRGGFLTEGIRYNFSGIMPVNVRFNNYNFLYMTQSLFDKDNKVDEPSTADPDRPGVDDRFINYGAAVPGLGMTLFAASPFYIPLEANFPVTYGENLDESNTSFSGGLSLSATPTVRVVEGLCNLSGRIGYNSVDFRTATQNQMNAEGMFLDLRFAFFIDIGYYEFVNLSFGYRRNGDADSDIFYNYAFRGERFGISMDFYYGDIVSRDKAFSVAFGLTYKL